MNLSFVLPTLFSLKYTIKPGRHYNFVTEKFATRVARRDTLIYTVTLSYLKKKKKKIYIAKANSRFKISFRGNDLKISCDFSSSRLSANETGIRARLFRRPVGRVYVGCG